MNGTGWVCDECGKTVVLDGDPFVRGGSGEPPIGWYLLFRAAPGRAATSERWEFCSVECIHAQTAPNGDADCPECIDGPCNPECVESEGRKTA